MAPPLPLGLMDDLIGEILIWLPPADPACLIRASLVYKSWRNLVLDRGFLRQYRAFHRTAPVLGFFHDQDCGYYDGDILVPRFVPTTTMRAPLSLPQPAASAGPGTGKGKRYSCCTLDCRHGRVLFHTVTVLWPSTTLTVWDPVIGDHKNFSPPSDVDPYYEFTGAVLCASDDGSGGGGHLDCSGGPFLVVIAGVSHGEDYDDDDVAWARVYSSETTAWGEATTLDVESFVNPELPSLVAAGAVYFVLGSGTRILKCDLAAGGALSVMQAPPSPPPQPGEPNIIFAPARDGELGVATVEGYSLHLWLWDAAVGGWTRARVIELDATIPISMGDPTTEFDVAGFARGAGLIFISADDAHQSIFTIEPKSGHINARLSGKIFPLINFCTPLLAS